MGGLNEHPRLTPDTGDTGHRPTRGGQDEATRTPRVKASGLHLLPDRTSEFMNSVISLLFPIIIGNQAVGAQRQERTQNKEKRDTDAGEVHRLTCPSLLPHTAPMLAPMSVPPGLPV